MSFDNSDDLIDSSILELFRTDAKDQTATLTRGLLTLERAPQDARELEILMRAAHSLKGASSMVNLKVLARVAHSMEDCFVGAQRGNIILQRSQIDLLLKGVDLLTRIADTPETAVGKWDSEGKSEVEGLISELRALEKGTNGSPAPVPSSEHKSEMACVHEAKRPAPVPESVEKPTPGRSSERLHIAPKEVSHSTKAGKNSDRVVRITAGSLDQLLGLAGESVVQSRWLDPFAQTLLRLKRTHYDLAKSLDGLRESVNANDPDLAHVRLAKAQEQVEHCRLFLADRLVELELFTRNSANLSHRLYTEVLTSRMRPFADGIQGFPRMVRDLSRSLGKEVKLETGGEDTQVDRDILEKIEAPLTHLLRNAIDHGIESPEQRRAGAKSSEGTIRLEAHHSAGMLSVTVSDDGRGLDLEHLRRTIVKKKLTTPEIATKLSEAELFEFLFLPGFSMKETISEISGRGVGLDVVQSMMNELRGTVRATSVPGKGMSFHLQLPLTLSVIRTLLVEIAGEPYTFPLARLISALKVPRKNLEVLQGRQHFAFRGQQIGILDARQVLEFDEQLNSGDELAVIIFGDRSLRYGLIVDKFIGERELVVQALDPHLGKLKNISSAALMADGSPVLIIDLDDLLRSVENIVSGNRVQKVKSDAQGTVAKKSKRILVVDDSLTVRELERKLLDSRGYEVEIAVDGMDGWNAIRTGSFDLIISDVDMPRMDGIELVRSIKNEPRLKGLPAMIVSYKDREQDRQRGLEAGADYYLTKGSFHDETLVNAVRDLIGPP